MSAARKQMTHFLLFGSQVEDVGSGGDYFLWDSFDDLDIEALLDDYFTGVVG